MSSVVIAGDTSGTVTLQAPSVAGTTTLTLPSTSGTVITGSGGVTAVANGGTGSSTLTANNVLLGNGTSALQAVAPGTSGNVLTSNGTTWTSAAPSGGVTSLNGQTGAITNTDYGAIGSYVIASTTFSASATISANTTVAGSTLNRTDYVSAGASTVARPLNGLAQGTVSVSTGIQTSLGLSGTWRAMTYGMNSTSGGAAAPLILWVRIS